MKASELHLAKNPDLIASLAAIKRAANLARQTVIQTNTAIVVIKQQESFQQSYPQFLWVKISFPICFRDLALKAILTLRYILVISLYRKSMLTLKPTIRVRSV
jgi:hypothetical protein